MHADIHDDDHTAPASSPLTGAQSADFWRAFTEQLSALQALPGVAFVERANALLQQQAPALSMELEGRPDEQGARLVLTAHGDVEQFENVQTLVRHVPEGLPYTVQAFRSRTLGGNFAMRMQDFELSCADVRVQHYDAGGITGLTLSFAKDIPDDMQEHARHMAFILLDHVLGEWDFSVRVGPVDFAEGEPQGAGLPLPSFPVLFDAFQREVLGRSYAFPAEAEDRWLSLKVHARDAGPDDEPDLLTFHDSANALATRADLSHLLLWTLPFSSQASLDAARDAQDALEAELLRLQRGVTAFTRLEGMATRVAAFYVDDPAHALQWAERLEAEYAPQQAGQLQLRFDPSWREYLDLYAVIHRNDRAAT
ncbi:hypothetical protein [Comamonas sp. GB3 AK4-5]|uniref:hypothetical protein n=1 Tax=Comamonas sp. GB3 AK4-5 TaxID=3231487 RepID=UPI00351EC9F8